MQATIRLPIWLMSIILTTIIASVSWAIADRISVAERVARTEDFLLHIEKRLDRIEAKVDRLLEERKKNAAH